MKWNDMPIPDRQTSWLSPTSYQWGLKKPPRTKYSIEDAFRDCSLSATKPKHKRYPQVLHSWMLHTCRKDDPPPCSDGFHRARRRTPCRYVTTVPLAILLPNVPLLSQAPGFYPQQAYQGSTRPWEKKKEGKPMWAEKKKKKRRGSRMQDRTLRNWFVQSDRQGKRFR